MSHLPRPTPFLVAIDGRSGAGKTTLAADLAALLRDHTTVGVFHLEDIYPGWDGLDDGVARYVDSVLRPLWAGNPAVWRAWDWERDEDGEERTTPPADVVLLEGVGAAAAAAREHLDTVVWVDAEDTLRCRTALERDGDTYAPFWQRWADQEAAWLAVDHPGGVADVVVQGHSAAAHAVLRALAGVPGFPAVIQQDRVLTCERIDAVPDPATLFAGLYGDSATAVWLDSSDTSGTAGMPGSRSRYSIQADDGGRHGQYAEHVDGITEVTAGAVRTRIRGPFFRWLDGVWGKETLRSPQELDCGFALGWIGYLGYELKQETGGRHVPRQGGDPPDAALLFAGRAVVLDHAEGTAYLLSLTDGRADEDLDAWRERARVLLTAPQQQPASSAVPVPVFTARDSREQYLAKVREAQAEIAEGNTYEVCLTTSLTARVEGADPFDAYLHLRQVSPAPFAHFLRFPGVAVASTSPERFLRLTAEGGLRAEPIKGTRGRSSDPALDAMLQEDLRTSTKDRAENIMIVDLLRNDLSHHAVPGSVTVSRLCDIETYTTVHQLVSTIDARLRPGNSRAAVVASAFPAGSMTGAPKISTMAILDRLEQVPRGPYSGASGYFSLTGAADLAVVIRTLVLQEDDDDGTRLTLGVGGAVTADSDPDEEWEEVRTKASGVLSALGAVFPPDGLPGPVSGPGQVR